MAQHRVQIKLDAVGKGSVLLDGRPVACRGVHVRTALHQITRVILELVNVDVEMDADAAVDGDVTTAEDDSVKYVNV